jgi:PST family polysaccharide transporter
MLQWQTVGNLFKLASWPLGFALVASARSRLYLSVELLWNGLFLGLIWIGLPSIGLTMAGMAFLAAYVAYSAFLSFLVRSQYGFRWEGLSLRLFAVFAVLILLLFCIARIAPLGGAVTSILLSLSTGMVGLRIVVMKIGPTGRVAGAVARAYAAFGWPIRAGHPRR